MLKRHESLEKWVYSIVDNEVGFISDYVNALNYNNDLDDYLVETVYPQIKQYTGRNSVIKYTDRSKRSFVMIIYTNDIYSEILSNKSLFGLNRFEVKDENNKSFKEFNEEYLEAAREYAERFHNKGSGFGENQFIKHTGFGLSGARHVNIFFSFNDSFSSVIKNRKFQGYTRQSLMMEGFFKAASGSHKNISFNHPSFLNWSIPERNVAIDHVNRTKCLTSFDAAYLTVIYGLDR